MKILKLHKCHYSYIEGAAIKLIAVADDTGINLVDVIAEMERYIIEETKVGDCRNEKVPSNRNGYTLEEGRLVKVDKNGIVNSIRKRVFNNLEKG